MTGRWAWAEIDVDAVTANVAHLRTVVQPSAVWAVVKAGGYGHGAARVGRAALAGGAGGLAVALAQEGEELRRAGIDAPVLVLSQQPQAEALVGAGLTPTVYTHDGIDTLVQAARALHGPRAAYGVHLKVDTGMHRVGAAPAEALDLARRIEREPTLRLAGTFTHLAVADEPGHPATPLQLARFEEVLGALRSAGIDPGTVHAANSAGALALPQARYDLVRCGIAVYGIAPGPGVADLAGGLTPALSLKARVSFVKRLRAGDSLSYGLRHTLERDATIATVPIGYADGVPRRLWATGGAVLVGGRRRPIRGVVTMDQLMVDCADDDVAAGHEVVLLGRQGDEAVTADEWAARLDTIAYEIVCGIGARVPRVEVAGAVTGSGL